jgi:hypothetical protein
VQPTTSKTTTLTKAYNMAQASAEKLLEQIEAFNQTDCSSLSPDLRTRLGEAAKTTSLKLETPVEVVTRVLVTQVS